MSDPIPKFRPSLLERALVKAFNLLNRLVPWHKLPYLVGIMNLAAIRISLRDRNLHDGYPPGHAATAMAEAEGKTFDERFLHARNSDGKYNSLEMPRMGCAGMRFGRQFPREYCRKPTEEELWNPSPRLVSERFMKRREKGFLPATTLNLLAASWIQFQTHDWMAHEKSQDSYNVPLPKGDPWPDAQMTLLKTQPDSPLDSSDERTPGYKNINTAWWDASQIYGSDEATTHKLRALDNDGKLAVADDAMSISYDAAGVPLTGFADNWWFGLDMLHSLWVLEHNAICEKLRESYPKMEGTRIFDVARLVNCALMAKIHTVEWTPAILGHPALQTGMSINWWGAVGETLNGIVGRLTKNSFIRGIPGSGCDMYGVPFSLTEEFVSVYRMHPLIPDNVALFNSSTGSHHSTLPTKDLLFTQAHSPFKSGLSLSDAFYSFGINYAGAITTNNYPDFLRSLRTPDGQFRDLATVDILRDRERGIPRYCQFRRLLRMSAPATFEELTGGNVSLASELEDVYGDIELVDLLVGSHSEPLIPGFGFSDTAFRIFVVMASNRLKSDRFFAEAWNEETYTAEGLAWVQRTTMKDVLLRHCPDLHRVLQHCDNVFAPWVKLPRSKAYGGVETNA
ncbi:hypothetical protein CDD80_4733 [Ophiocordyceps camponoti-rufipedis]|uniref:Heme peroxidase n=1 Tax=Ophiocordyceps camponoti-rufipedis TaxID=2004952 RepID=A0A2C5YYN2_9HYPO|nr:hypothetical protein CDD80_4733 [Ophiocordyceps camponoti-rufipedis]